MYSRLSLCLSFRLGGEDLSNVVSQVLGIALGSKRYRLQFLQSSKPNFLPPGELTRVGLYACDRFRQRVFAALVFEHFSVADRLGRSAAEFSMSYN